MLRIIRENGASEDVDLVSEGRVTLFMTPEEEESARVDFEAAKAAGLGRLGSVKWIDRETMNEVGLLVSLKFVEGCAELSEDQGHVVSGYLDSGE